MPSESQGGWQYPLCKINGAEMAGFLKRVFGNKDVAFEDAKTIYSKLMTQSRNPEFYGEGKVPDNYDGRIDLLTLHISAVLEALNKYGQQGERLSQAIYDVMRDDFEIAMREEGISDTGIKRRIKPMMQLFFTRTKTYVEALQNNSDISVVLAQGLLKDGNKDFQDFLGTYLADFSKILSDKSLGDIALGDFTFPK